MAHSVFKKLADGQHIDYQVLDKRIEFDLDTAGHKIQYFNVVSDYANNFIARLGKYSAHFYTSFVSIEADVPPHTDIVDRVSFNFYIETGGYQTTFYRGDQTATRSVYADHGDGHVYQMDELEPIASFVADPGDVYILNGKVIHGVGHGSGLPRKFLQISANDLDYEQVLDIVNASC